MFGDTEEPIVEMLKYMELEECLDYLGVTPEEVLTILYKEGHVSLPEWLKIEDHLTTFEEK